MNDEDVMALNMRNAALRGPAALGSTSMLGTPNVQPIRESIGPGSVVRMKSGGPSMVVIERSTNWAYVTWHKDDGNDVLKDWIPTACLELVK